MIADVGNAEYYKTRAVELIQSLGDMESTKLAIQLLVLSIAERNNASVQS